MLNIQFSIRRSLAFAWVLFSLSLANPLFASITSNQFSFGGYLNSGSPGSFDLAALENYATSNPASQRSVSVPNSGGGTDVYTGISLNSFLSSYVKTDPTVPKNDILRDYVVATGTDGYRSVFSLGELSTSFGNRNDIIAYQLNGADLTTNGFARIVAPGDVKAGRWVSNLASLEVGHVDYSGPGAGGVSTQFTINGQVLTPTTYTAADLPGSLTPSTVTVTTTGGPSNAPLGTFTGVSLWDLVNQSGIITDTSKKNDILGKILIATGTDNYSAVFSLGELNPDFGNQPDLLAYQNAAGVPLGADGFARIVVPNDIKGGRYVSNLTSLTVVNIAAVPSPTAAMLILSGLIVAGLGNFRKRLYSAAW